MQLNATSLQCVEACNTHAWHKGGGVQLSVTASEYASRTLGCTIPHLYTWQHMHMPVLFCCLTAHSVTWSSISGWSEFLLLLPCILLLCTLIAPALLNHLIHVTHWRAPRCSCTVLLHSRRHLCLLRLPGLLKILDHSLYSTQPWEALDAPLLSSSGSFLLHLYTPKPPVLWSHLDILRTTVHRPVHTLASFSP